MAAGIRSGPPRDGHSRRRLVAGAAAGCIAAATRAALPVTEPQSPGPEAALPRRWLRVGDGTRLSLVDTGPQAADGPAPLFFVPGWCMPASIWQPQIEAFRGSRRVLALDPRGQGESDVPAEGYTAQRRADDIAEALDGLPPVVLVAWSLAVLESLVLFERHGAGRIAGLVLVDNSVGEPPAPGPNDFLARLRAKRRPTLENFCRAIFARPQPPQRIEALVEGAMRMPLEASIRLLSYPYPRERWRDLARAFPAPLAYVVTTNFAAQAESLAAHRGGTRVEVFRDAGHALFVDDAARFNAFLGEFGGIRRG